MSQESGKRLGYITPAQRSLLVELVTADKNLLNSKFTNEFTFQHARQRWEEISKQCNAIPGCSKDWKHWRKTWQDLRCKTKSKAAAMSKHASGTGGGPSSGIELTHEESAVLDVISPIAVSGHTQSTESGVEFEDVTFEYIDKTQSSAILPEVAGSSSYTQMEKNMVEQGISSVPNQKKSKRIVAQRRLQSSLAATELLGSQGQKKLEMKEEMNTFFKEYYVKKLAILKEKSDAMKSIALSLDKIADKM